MKRGTGATPRGAAPAPSIPGASVGSVPNRFPRCHLPASPPWAFHEPAGRLLPPVPRSRCSSPAPASARGRGGRLLVHGRKGLQSAQLSPISSSSSLALGRFAPPVRLLAGVVVSALLMVPVPISRSAGSAVGRTPAWRAFLRRSRSSPHPLRNPTENPGRGTTARQLSFTAGSPRVCVLQDSTGHTVHLALPAPAARPHAALHAPVHELGSSRGPRQQPPVSGLVWLVEQRTGTPRGACTARERGPRSSGATPTPRPRTRTRTRIFDRKR